MAQRGMGQNIPVLILKEDTTRTKGRETIKRNIQVAKITAEILMSALGPRGMDKMLVDSLGDVVITNDGATILKEMDVEHPAAKIMVEIAKAQDNEVGDGTTTVVVLAGKLLEMAEELIDKDIHPTTIVEGYKQAANKALEFLSEIAIEVKSDDRDVLRKTALTSMASKVVSGYKESLADIAVDAVLAVKTAVDDEVKVDIDDIKIEKKKGGSIADTTLVNGIVLDKEVVHPRMPKRIEKAKVALINSPLEIEKTEFDARIRIDMPHQIKDFLEQERALVKEKVDKLIEAGANVVICQKGIDDRAQFYLASAGVLAVRRVKQSDMEKLAKATGARIVTNVEELSSGDLGEAEIVEERKIGEDKLVFIEGCKNPKSLTILIRGGSDRIIDEVERSLHDAISVVKDVLIRPYIVAGGGAPEMELSMRIRNWAEGLSGREQLAAIKFADAIETVPIVLANNAGMDVISVETELKSLHKKGSIWSGVDVLNGKIADMLELNIIEPVVVKEQAIKSSTEATSMILRIDDMIAAARMKGKPSEEAPQYPGGYPGGYPGMPGGFG